jgi:hypothetical protein
MDTVMSAAYQAGFRSEEQLLIVTSIAVRESSLYQQTRNWQPEFGHRPAGSQLGVQGPSWVYSGNGSQLHADRGLWQISSQWWPQYGDATVDDPYQAARLVYTISKGGQTSTPGTPTGAGLLSATGTTPSTAGPRCVRRCRPSCAVVAALSPAPA